VPLSNFAHHYSWIYCYIFFPLATKMFQFARFFFYYFFRFGNSPSTLQAPTIFAILTSFFEISRHPFLTFNFFFLIFFSLYKIFFTFFLKVFYFFSFFYISNYFFILNTIKMVKVSYMKVQKICTYTPNNFFYFLIIFKFHYKRAPQ